MSQNDPPPLRVAATVVMDQAMLSRAKEKAEQHQVDFSEFLEQAVRLYGKVLDRKVMVVGRR